MTMTQYKDELSSINALVKLQRETRAHERLKVGYASYDVLSTTFLVEDYLRVYRGLLVHWFWSSRVGRPPVFKLPR
jgi:hypothetical protein